MEKIKKYSLINLILAIIFMVAGTIQLYYQGEYYVYRRLRAIIGYFIILPILLSISIITLIVLKHYFKTNFKKPYKYIFYSIPSILILLYVAISLLEILFVTFW